MRKIDFLIITIAMMVAMTACQNRNQTTAIPSPTVTGNPTVSPTAAPSMANNPTDKWLGQWDGVEGTYLLLSKDGDKYAVKIQSLDNLETYEGVSAGDHIEFKRDGKTESIRAGSGKETGLKWLLDEKNCLIIKEGEGFCRK